MLLDYLIGILFFGDFRILFVCALFVLVCMSGFFPASIAVLAFSSVFSLFESIQIALIGLFVSSTLSFFIARIFFKKYFDICSAKYPKFHLVRRSLEDGSWLHVFVFRLSPVVPFGMVSYLMGATRISYVNFIFGTLGTIPSLIVLVLSGYIAGAGAKYLNQDDLSLFNNVVLMVGIVATLFICFKIFKILKLSEHFRSNRD
jgi:uncharacterized membrane protein YdjX (TVP38/TMEM64 family)